LKSSKHTKKTAKLPFMAAFVLLLALLYSMSANIEQNSFPADQKSLVSLRTSNDLEEKLEAYKKIIPTNYRVQLLDYIDVSSGELKLDSKAPQELISLLKEAYKEEDLLVLADKQHFLAADFVPKGLQSLKDFSPPLVLNRADLSLEPRSLKALLSMVEAAKKDGILLDISSSYRSYAYQDGLFKRNVKELGRAQALRESAQPGTSQHQLGTALDFGSVTQSFGTTKAGLWLKNNAETFGFSLSFPEGLEDLTGYMYEPWHFRYLGPAACKIQKNYFADVQQLFLVFLHDFAPEVQSLLRDS